MRHERARLFLFSQALIAPTIILLIYSYINYRQITPFQYPGVNRCFYSLILDFAFHNAFHHGYSYLPKLKPEFKVGHRAGFADTQTTIKGWMLEEVQVMKNS